MKNKKISIWPEQAFASFFYDINNSTETKIRKMLSDRKILSQKYSRALRDDSVSERNVSVESLDLGNHSIDDKCRHVADDDAGPRRGRIEVGDH